MFVSILLQYKGTADRMQYADIASVEKMEYKCTKLKIQYSLLKLLCKVYGVQEVKYCDKSIIDNNMSMRSHQYYLALS